MSGLAGVPLEVRVNEVGPRDGLQNEAAVPGVEVKLALIEGLVAAGLRRIEVGALVSPRRVPAMAASAEVARRLPASPGVVFSVLVPDLRGCEAARDLGLPEVAVFAAASETFSRRNVNAGIEETLARVAPACAAAAAAGITVRGYVSCALGCPYEGRIEPGAVARVVERLLALGCREVALGDTTGVGDPRGVLRLLDAVTPGAGLDRLAVHFHDTYGRALANVLTALDRGISSVDSSVAGLGGCPFASGAAGNLATEDLVAMLDGMGVATGVDLGRLREAGRAICGALGRAPASRVALALGPAGGAPRS